MDEPFCIDPFDGLSVCAALAAEGLALPASVLDETGSTNDDGKRLLLSGRRPPFIVAAAAQRAGRGRGTHSFHSPEGAGLYASFIVDLPAEALIPLVTPLAAVAVLRAVRRTTGRQLTIKWVNDLFYNGKKVCGILAERVGTAAVIGVGVNLRAQAFPPALNDVATSLETHVPRAALLAAIASELSENLAALPDTGFLNEYRASSLIIGKTVTFTKNGQQLSARALAIDDLAGLVVRYADGRTETLTSGEVSVQL